MLKAPDGSLRGVGFVQFIKPEDAMRALAALHNKQASVSGSKSSCLVYRCACLATLLHWGGKGRPVTWHAWSYVCAEPLSGKSAWMMSAWRLRALCQHMCLCVHPPRQ